MADEKMDVQQVLKLLDIALPLQMRSAALYTWASGSAVGIDFLAVAQKLENFGSLELEDGRRLMEKMVALGGDPTTDIASFRPFPPTEEGLGKLIEWELETTEALREVIPATGQEARSEALEHLLEHIIMRKHEQIDFLKRVCRTA